ncbi:MAG: 3-dehydroquinate dehydratase-2 [Pseudoalteromonas tetraodonis]|jgi:3-dehydroquinate dehydratase-2|uniref:3-dehydroquinate dehydratase n=4 Tax=Pseudoalteromonas TaxID=53246 RepID=A0AA37W3Q1_9GAMM|nr:MULTISPECIES: type II 3-dehydroquinate dehydratase [Pseudoalteromonas]MAY58364.1 type II 3-dehydroquinate dehydratase [Pseudoalteromonas sp.]ABF56506.1 3-dehydroquinate dehydratase [Pseudoalteromonas sp. SM9913]ADT69740.1 3-dehydroquinate dehydratase [Pseudoalteromonas sp. SM9913]ALQ56027.1 3-dehydroquinate dehydratase [Pseudoalteromonas issachenkonii]ATC91919.1 3-dehydroquinate dehydratase II [Pseudoalteromonas issachenkonii]|tara:strand:+ start:1397 stop:1849 length:453 start_codon:yes stop_codon:yes gene_type:complete
MAAKLKILVINGPNLNMLGKREPDKYGSHSLEHIMSELNSAANSLDVALTHFQSNSEQALIERIHDAWQAVDYIIINPAAFTHTSVALRDALLSVDIPFFEVHLSNVHARETFRHHSYFSDVAQGVICGLGAMGYHAALHAAVSRLQNSN